MQVLQLSKRDCFVPRNDDGLLIAMTNLDYYGGVIAIPTRTRDLRYHEHHVEPSIKCTSPPAQSPHTVAIAVAVMGRVSGCFSLSRVCRAGGQLVGRGSTNTLPGKPGHGQESHHHSPLGIAQRRVLQQAPASHPV